MRVLKCMRAWRRGPESPVLALLGDSNGAGRQVTIQCTVTAHVMNRLGQRGNPDYTSCGYFAALQAAAHRRGCARESEL
jgi:hypothetical protein